MVSFRRKELLEGVYGMGFNKPSKIQEVALPILVADPWVDSKNVHVMTVPVFLHDFYLFTDLAYYYYEIQWILVNPPPLYPPNLLIHHNFPVPI